MSKGWRQVGRDPGASNQLGLRVASWVEDKNSLHPQIEATGLPQLAGTLPLAGWDDHILGLL